MTFEEAMARGEAHAARELAKVKDDDTVTVSVYRYAPYEGEFAYWSTLTSRGYFKLCRVCCWYVDLCKCKEKT